MRILHIVGNETAKALLPGCVPQLNSIVLVVSGNIFYVEVDSDSGLSKENRYIEAFLELVLYVLFDD